MLIKPKSENIDTLSIIVMAEDGRAFVLRRRHGSGHVTLADMRRWAEERSWLTESVPDRLTGLIQNLGEAYEQYLYYKSEELELSADQWLNVSDRLAGKLSEIVERGTKMPEVVTVYVPRRTPSPPSRRFRRGSKPPTAPVPVPVRG
ncbi:MAG: hypothetical protein ABIO72_05850 [Patescibacteria group bacterium]